MILLYIYLGVALPWLIMAPKFVWNYLGYGGVPDVEDICFSLFLGLLSTVLWPAVVVGFAGYKVMYASTDSSYWNKPKLPRSPAKVMSDRRERKASARAIEQKNQRLDINTREKELGLPLSTWED